MNHAIPHGLSHELAREATRHALDSYRIRFPQVSPQGDWVSPDEARISFTVAGTTLRGKVVVTDREIQLELDVPLVFRPFRKRALELIENEVRGWLDRAREGGLS
ncbi:MAG: polyhydroxyalkanoic acid system family protein [Alphaproteobacteria bacterium]|nr:polyhydroxyalkanoic acid system family protein [Alphaproteobacteria bacterium]